MPGPWGKAIEMLRLTRGMTRDRAAKRANMTPTTYGRIEKGQHTQTQKLQAIANAFNVNIDEVLHTKLLQNGAASGNTALPLPIGAQTNGSHRSVLTDDAAAAIAELQSQVRLLQKTLAQLFAEREISERRRSERLSKARLRKQSGLRDARKSR